MNIQKNQIFTVKITDMGTDGEGIGHLEDSGAFQAMVIRCLSRTRFWAIRACKSRKTEKGICLCASGRSAGTVARPRGAGLCVCETVWRLSAAGGFL